MGWYSRSGQFFLPKTAWPFGPDVLGGGGVAFGSTTVNRSHLLRLIAVLMFTKNTRQVTPSTSGKIPILKIVFTSKTGFTTAGN